MSQNQIDPSELTSPGTISDPALEERRAREAAEREAESRASSETKFEELRHEVEAERSEAAQAVGDVPAPLDERLTLRRAVRRSGRRAPSTQLRAPASSLSTERWSAMKKPCERTFSNCTSAYGKPLTASCWISWFAPTVLTV